MRGLAALFVALAVALILTACSGRVGGSPILPDTGFGHLKAESKVHHLERIVDRKSLSEQEQNAIHFYLGRIFQKLQTHKHYPKVAEQKGLSGQALLRFTVLSDGKVIDPQIKVIGHISFGEATLQALKQVGQLPPFPNVIRQRELMVEVPIAYQIETRTSGQLLQEFSESLRRVGSGSLNDWGLWQQ